MNYRSFSLESYFDFSFVTPLIANRQFFFLSLAFVVYFAPFPTFTYIIFALTCFYLTSLAYCCFLLSYFEGDTSGVSFPVLKILCLLI